MTYWPSRGPDEWWHCWETFRSLLILTFSYVSRRTKWVQKKVLSVTVQPRGGSTLEKAGTCSSDSLVAPPPDSKKLADRSGWFLRSQNAPKSKFSDPAGGAYSAPPNLLADGEGGSCHPPTNPTPCRPFGPRFYGSHGLTHYRVGNRTNDRFQM